MKRGILLGLALLGIMALSGCDKKANEEETVVPTKEDSAYQVSVMPAFSNGEYDGLITVNNLKNHGDTGVGVYDGLDGELIILDGQPYHVQPDGSIIWANGADKIAYASVCYLESDIVMDAFIAENVAELENRLGGAVDKNGRNQIYFVKYTGYCDSMTLLVSQKQEKPYDTYRENFSKEYTFSNIKGTIIGVYYPEFMDTVNGAGWTFYYISEESSKGGRVKEFSHMSGDASLDKMSQYSLVYPNSASFNEIDTGK